METNGKPKLDTIKIKKIFADHWDEFAQEQAWKINQVLKQSSPADTRRDEPCPSPL